MIQINPVKNIVVFRSAQAPNSPMAEPVTLYLNNISDNDDDSPDESQNFFRKNLVHKLKAFLNNPVVQVLLGVLETQLAFLNEGAKLLDDSGLSMKFFKKNSYGKFNWVGRYLIDPLSLFGIVWGSVATAAHKGQFAGLVKGLFLLVFSFFLPEPVIHFFSQRFTKLFGNTVLNRFIGGSLGIALLETVVQLGDRIAAQIKKFLKLHGPQDFPLAPITEALFSDKN